MSENVPIWMGGGASSQLVYQGIPSINVLLSYSQQDEALSDDLTHFLARGRDISFIPENNVNVFGVGVNVRKVYPFRVWRSIKGNAPWQKALMNGMEQCEILLIIVPREQSVSVALECGIAMGLGKTIVPIAQETSLLHEYGLDHLNSYNWDGAPFDSDDREKLFQALLNKVGRSCNDFSRYSK